MRYQPIWRDGKEVTTGERDASGRYEAIKRELHGHVGFSVLDVGAYTGYFSVRLAEDFDASVVAVDRVLRKHPIDSPRVVTIPRNLSRDELDWLTRDGTSVMLLLSVLHHMPWWRDVITLAVERTRIAFIEIPDPREILPNAVAHHESRDMHVQIQRLGGNVIGWTDGYDSRYSRPLYALGSIG